MGNITIEARSHFQDNTDYNTEAFASLPDVDMEWDMSTLVITVTTVYARVD